MCELITMASIGLGIAQSAASYQAASAQAKAQSATSKQNAINASRAAEDQYSNIGIKMQQEGSATYQQKMESSIEAAQASASTEAAAASGGVTGNSVGHVLRDIYAQWGRNDTTLDTNLSMTKDSLQKEKDAARSGAQSQINSVPKGQKPSWVPYALQGGASALNNYTSGRSRNKYG